MMRSILLLSTGLALVACKATPVVEVDVPAEIGWVAVVTVGEAGAVRRATPLVRWSADAPLPLITRAGEGETALLLGFSETQLEMLGVEVDDSPLQALDGCGRALPPPVWVGRWAGGALSAHDGPAPRVTAPWLSTACPDLSGEPVLVDADCFETRCEPSVRWIGRCDLELDLSSCGIGNLPASVDVDGSICADFSAAGWRCDRTTDPVARAAYTCLEPAPCELHVHAGGAPPAPFEIARRQLVEGEPYLPGRLDRLGVLTTDDVADGHLLELLVLPGAVVVSRTTREPATSCYAADAQAGELLYLDPESLLSVRTATAPYCLRRMVRDEGGGFVGAYVEGEELFLGRFDRRGRLTGSAPVDERTDAQPGEPRLVQAGSDRVLEMVMLEGRLVVLLGKGRGDSFLFTFDAATLRPILREQIRSGTSGMVVAGGGVVATTRNGEQEMAWLDVSSAEEVAAAKLPWRDLPRETDSLLSVLEVPATGEILVTGTPPPALFVLESMGPTRARAVIFERDAYPVTMAPWPAGDPVFVAGIEQETDGRWSSVGALFDPTRGRFLPGTWPLGNGVVGRIRVDDAGRLWLLLPWSGEVIRLTPR